MAGRFNCMKLPEPIRPFQKASNWLSPNVANKVRPSVASPLSLYKTLAPPGRVSILPRAAPDAGSKPRIDPSASVIYPTFPMTTTLDTGNLVCAQVICHCHGQVKLFGAQAPGEVWVKIRRLLEFLHGGGRAV